MRHLTKAVLVAVLWLAAALLSRSMAHATASAGVGWLNT